MSSTISGNAGVANATVSYSGTASGSVTADGNGNYKISGLANGSYTLTPLLSGYTFSPPSQSETVSGANIQFNFTASNSSAWSEPDTRNSNAGNYPNGAIADQGTQLYVVPASDSRVSGPPIDSRTTKPIDSRAPAIVPENSRTSQK